MIDFTKVGLKITEYRKIHNLTQDDIADKLYVSRQLVSKWENGTGAPSIDALLSMCKLFHVSFEELLCLDDELVVDSNDIFKGHNRIYIIQNIINGNIEINLADAFYQFSPIERMMVLKAIKEGKMKCEMQNLFPKLTPVEQAYLRKEDSYDLSKIKN